jgi:hypothetical protein
MRELMAIAMSMDNMKIFCELPFKDKTITELDLRRKNLGIEGARVVAEYLDGNGALTKLIFGGGKDYRGKSYAPATLEIGMTEADLSNMNLGDGGATIVAAWVSHKDNGAMTSLNLASNMIGSEGIIALAKVIPDMEALSSVNLLKNNIPVEQAQELVKIMQSKENLTTLCGLSGEETELDFSGQELGDGDAVLIANDVSDMRASSGNFDKFEQLFVQHESRELNDQQYADELKNLSTVAEKHTHDNGALSKLIFGGDGYVVATTMQNKKIVTPVPATLEVGMTEADFSNKNLGAGGAIVIGAWISHKDNGAMSILNLAENNIGGYYRSDGQFVATPEGITSFCVA